MRELFKDLFFAKEFRFFRYYFILLVYLFTCWIVTLGRLLTAYSNGAGIDEVWLLIVSVILAPLSGITVWIT